MATAKQKKALAIMAENGGVASTAMIEAGYSPQTAVTPGKLTNSKGFQELIDEFLPEKHLMKKHRAFLDSPRIIRRFKKGELEEETEETDPNAVRALDMAYKIRGSYKTEGNGNNVLVINLSEQTGSRYAIDPGTSTDS